MAKTNIVFNNKNYSIDDASLSAATAALKSHLSTVMNGSGAVINLVGTHYNIDSAKLQTATNAFVSHLGTVAGSGYKVVVSGVEYGVGSDKMAGAIGELEAVLGSLHSEDGGHGDELGFPISWNSMGVMGNTSFIFQDMPFVKVSEFTPSSSELEGTAIGAMGEHLPCTQVMDMGGAVAVLYGDSGEQIVFSVSDAGEYADFGITFPESGFYVTDFGSMGLEADFVIDKLKETLATPYVSLNGKVLTIEPVENAEAYEVYVNESLFATTVETTVDLSNELNDDESCWVKVKAIHSSSYNPSDYGMAWYSNSLLTPGLYQTGAIALYETEGFDAASNLLTKTWAELIKEGVFDGNGEVIDGQEQLIAGDLIIPYGTTDIVNNAFRYCPNLTNVLLPDGVNSIGNWAFEGCENLVDISLPSTLTSIGGAAFANCEKLALTSLPSGITSIGSSAFYRCENLALTTLPSGITSIGSYTFYGCNNLELTSLPSGVTYIGSHAFELCNKVALTSLPSGITRIETTAFRGCPLTLTSLPSGIKTIDARVFESCGSLTSITIPAGVTSIGASAFNYCRSLTSITIPDSVTSIGESAFWHCDNLTDIAFEGTVEQWNAINKGDHWNSYVPATYVQCSDGTVSLI